MTRRLAVVALASVVGLTGCASEEKRTAEARATPRASTSPTPTPTPSPTKPVAIPPEQPEFAQGSAGKEAFAEYVVHAWAYSLATNDSSLLDEVSAGGKPCLGCEAQSDTLAQRESEGWSVYPFKVTIDKIRLIETALGTTARVRFDIPETKSFFDDGSFRNISPAHPESTFTVAMKTAENAYELVAFSIT